MRVDPRLDYTLIFCLMSCEVHAKLAEAARSPDASSPSVSATHTFGPIACREQTLERCSLAGRNIRNSGLDRWRGNPFYPTEFSSHYVRLYTFISTVFLLSQRERTEYWDNSQMTSNIRHLNDDGLETRQATLLSNKLQLTRTAFLVFYPLNKRQVHIGYCIWHENHLWLRHSHQVFGPPYRSLWHSFVNLSNQTSIHEAALYNDVVQVLSGRKQLLQNASLGSGSPALAIMWGTICISKLVDYCGCCPYPEWNKSFNIIIFRRKKALLHYTPYHTSFQAGSTHTRWTYTM